MRPWLAPSLVCVLAAGASGQTGREYKTIEARVGLATSVYRGKIVAFELAANPRAPGLPFYVLTIGVDEVVKGIPTASFQITAQSMDGTYHPSVYRALVQNRTPFLWFLGKQEPGTTYAKFQDYLQASSRDPANKGFYPRDSDGVFTLDFSVLRSPDAILSRARSFAKAHPEVMDAITFEIPNSLAALCALPGVYAAFTAPGVPEFEATARRMVLHPEAILAATWANRSEANRERDLGQLRHSGVLALKAFRSSENEALLKGLLADPTVSKVYRYDAGAWKPAYWIREAAYNVLRGWGARVEKPTLEPPATP